MNEILIILWHHRYGTDATLYCGSEYDLPSDRVALLKTVFNADDIDEKDEDEIKNGTSYVDVIGPFNLDDVKTKSLQIRKEFYNIKRNEINEKNSTK